MVDVWLLGTAALLAFTLAGYGLAMLRVWEISGGLDLWLWRLRNRRRHRKIARWAKRLEREINEGRCQQWAA